MVYYLGRDVKVYLTTESVEAQVDVASNEITTTTVTSGSAGNVAATATITFTGAPNSDENITIISTDGTSLTYISATAGNAGTSDLHFSIGGGTATSVATTLKTAIESAGGHNGKITLTRLAGVLTLTQATTGTDGNRDITEDLVNVTKTNFTGGADARIPVFEPANLPPVGVLKTDRKRLFSNIDNDLISKNGRILNGITPYGTMPYTDTVTAYCDNPARTGAQIKVTYQEAITGGVKAVASVRIKAKGDHADAGKFENNDLDDAAIFIKTMDAHYMCYWNVDSRQNSPTDVDSYNPDVHTPVVATPTSDGSGAAGAVSTAQLVLSMVNALNAVKFPASTGRTEFTASWDGVASGTEVITIINNREGKIVETGAWITNQQGPLCAAGGPFDVYGSDRVLSTTTGVSPSGGNVKQKTLTTITDKTTSTSKIETVERILKVELINNIEATDSYGGTTDASKLYPGEKIYLLSSIHSTLTGLPNTSRRNIDTNIHNTICYVSLGNPIVELNSLGGHALFDASESKIRCSNKSLAYYYFDDNKLISGDNVESDGDTEDADAMSIQNHQEADTTDVSFGITDKLVDGISQKTTVSSRELRYSHEWWREHTDANYRFYPQKRLVRCQIDDNHTQVADDSFSRSPIEHWDYSGYLKASGAGNQDNNQPSEVSKHNYGAFLFTNKAQARAPNWKNLNTTNRADKFPIFHCTPPSVDSSGNIYNNQLLISTSFDTHDVFSAGSEHYEPDNRTIAMAVGSTNYNTNPDSVTIGPRNALFMTKKEKYDRIFVRVSHDLFNSGGADITDITNNPTPGTTVGMPKVRLQILYPVKNTSVIGSSEDKVVWKALPYIDGTSLNGKDDSTFYKSGDISFTSPPDWVKTSHSTMNPTTATDTNIIYPFEDNFFEDGSGTTGINDAWTEDSYALIFLITVIDSVGDGSGVETARHCFSVTSMYPYNNSHSQLIEIIDPTHVSLNKFGIAQSVSFVRKGTYQEIKDRSGISQMRRVGTKSGAIKLGSIDLKGDVQTTRVKFQEFQKDATPVYYDVIHKDSSITRLYGVMTDMSEDHPTGKITPKFACTMKVTHILELDSSGNILDNGYVPLGGDVIDVNQYLSAG